MIVSKKVSFDAAHYLPNYEGPCSKMHGHHWVVELGVEGQVEEDGMVVDFAKLKDFLEKEIEEKLDHTCLNDLGLSFSANPTAENICLYIKDRFKASNTATGEHFFSNVWLAFIKVWETEDSCVEFQKGRIAFS